MHKPKSQTVPELLAELALHDGERIALIDGDKSLNYGELEQQVLTCARALIDSGIEHGDRVGILAGNRAEWLVCYFASMSIGAIAVGLNTWSTASELAYQLGHAKVRLLFFEAQFRDRDFIALIAEAQALASSTANGLASLEHQVCFDDLSAEMPAISYFAPWLAAVPDREARPLPSVKGTDVGCLLYTSGSTALPKGVPLLHAGLINNMWEIGERQHLQADDRLWLAVSLFWSLACVNATFAVITHRGTIVLQHQFDAGQALETIERERCTVFYGTPNMALALAEHEHISDRDISSLRTGVTIGTPAQIQRVADLGVRQICNVYGLTEGYGNSTVTDADLPLEQRINTVGQVLPGSNVRIVDPNSLAPCAQGTAGEIILTGNITPGYWQDPERTAEAFTEDGWFRTGDLGLLDENGYLHYRGRIKEMVKSGGINVAPAEVEETLSSHPAIELVFVTGIPDPRLDETLAAVIVLKPGQKVSEAALVTHCRATMAPYKTPRHFRFVEAKELPLTSTGKLQRNRLAELFS